MSTVPNKLANIHRLVSKPAFWGWVDDMYLAGNDCGIAMRLNDGQDYEARSREIWKARCDGGLAIDVGAHTGRYSLDAFKAGAERVLSIEPYHLNFARLVLNLRHAGYSTDNCVFGAASDMNAMIDLRVITDTHYCSAGAKFGRSDHPKARMYPVRAKRLDNILSENLHRQVRIVKIDTEGHVASVLRGMPSILSWKPDLILECIEDGLTEILAPLGYKFYTINEKTGATEVDRLEQDAEFSFDTPNRFASVRGLP